MRPLLKKKSVIVVKIGTSILSDSHYRIDLEKMQHIADELCALRRMGFSVIAVSSGAIGAGMGLLGMKVRPQTLPDLQAAAAIGQAHLINLYDHCFKPYGCLAGQVLLTRDDFHERKRYLNAKNTLFSLIEKNAIPIINENDTVSVDEIRFGDNDRLSAFVASLVNADLLILLSDVEGLYKVSPEGIRQELIPFVEKVDQQIFQYVCNSKKEVCVGGMTTKLEAAKIAMHAGFPMIIASGMMKNVLQRIVQGDTIGTYFAATKKQLSSKKQWIAYIPKVKGALVIDEGAVQALLAKGKSLLASGICEVKGHFSEGDAVKIESREHKEIGRGLTHYSSKDIDKIKGCKTADIESILGHKLYDEVIHRNNMVIWDKN